jgi:hypothetical protein
MPRCERDANNFASDADDVRGMAAGTSPHAFLDRAVRRPFFDQDIGPPVTSDAPGSDGLRISDVHAQCTATFPQRAQPGCRSTRS